MIIKPITPEDKLRVLEIASKIWDGDDYIDRVFNRWIKDKTGKFIGLWQDGILVAFGKMSYLSTTDVWLEGLRKDQDLNIKGVGKIIAKYYFKELRKKKNIKSIRFSTYFDNKPSIRLNEKLGFRKILTLSLKYLELKKEKTFKKPGNLTCDFKFEQIKIFIENSKYLNKSRKFLSKGWVAYHYTRELLRELYKSKKIVVWLENNSLKGAIIYNFVDYNKVLWISLLETDDEYIFYELLNFVKYIAVENQKKEIQILLPQIPELKNFCYNAGFRSWERDNDFLLYEFPVAALDEINI
jgi:hypothetical protein